MDSDEFRSILRKIYINELVNIQLSNCALIRIKRVEDRVNIRITTDVMTFCLSIETIKLIDKLSIEYDRSFYTEVMSPGTDYRAALLNALKK